MRKAKKFLVVLVCVAILSNILAACGKSETPQQQSATSTNEQSASTEKPAATLPYAGEEIVYKGLGADLTMTEDPNSPIFKEYQKMLGNVKIQWDMLPFSEYDNKVKLFLSSGDIPDVMWMRDSLKNSSTYGDSGMFLDFEKYKDYMSNLQEVAKNTPALKYLLTDKGARYALPNIMATDYVGEGFMYNKTLLDKLGVSVPTTVDEFYTAMKTIKEKDPSITPFLTDGGGTPGADYTLYAFANMFGTGSNNGFTPSGGDMKYDKASKKWSFDPVSDPNYKAFLEFISKCYKDKLLDPSVVSMSSDAAKAKTQLGKWAFTYNYTSAIDGWYWPVNQGKKTPIEVEPMLTPAYNGKSNFFLTVIRDGAPYWGYFASAEAKNPEILAAVLDLCYSPKANDLYNWGIEGVTYKTENGKKTFTDDVISNKFNFNTQRFMLLRYVSINPPLYSNDYSLAQQPITKKVASFFLQALKDGKMQASFAYAPPPISTEDGDKFAKIMNPIRTYVKESELKFLTGKTTMSDWNRFIDDMKKYGNLDEALQIYNNGKNFDLGDRVTTNPEDIYGGK